MNTDVRTLVIAFLALPSEALPSAVGDDDDDNIRVWFALRDISRGHLPALSSDRVYLSAARDEWRDGITIEVPTFGNRNGRVIA